MEINIIPCLKDNYAYIINDKKSKIVSVIDPSEALPIINFLNKRSFNV